MEPTGAPLYRVKQKRVIVFVVVCAVGALALGLAWSARAQIAKFEGGTDGRFPDYYPTSNGVRRLKSLVTAARWRFGSNDLLYLTEPKLQSYREDGTTLEWTATSLECTFNPTTKEVRGNTNMVFKTADERLFVTGVGFFWQQSSSVLTLSNQTLTRIDKLVLTNNAAKNQ